jgi:xyloglucan 6-xylosyltransferase
VTIMCGLMTVLVLRGTIGAGQFGTPAQDFEEIRMHLKSATGGMMLGSGRVLAQVEEENKVRPAKRLLLKEDKDDKDQISNDPNKPYRLGPVITDWDQQRQAWKAKNPNVTTTTKGKPRMLLVTGSQPTACENPVGDHYLLMSIKNKIDYCRLHNIEIFYNMAHLDAEMAGFWAKLPLIRKLMLGHPQVEWIWWMDSDAMFTDMLFEVPLEKYEKYNLVMHGFDELVFKEKSWTGLNTGSFLIRNCQWTLDLLDAWAPMGPKGIIRDKAGALLAKALKGRPNFEADDQSALVYLLVTQTDEWADKVFLENSYYLHGYWAILVDHYEEMMEKYHPGLGDHRWPFVTHFVGCKPCSKVGDYSVDRCLTQMERAFNFGDNQILEMLGFKHRSLISKKVKRVRNDTDDPLQLKAELLLSQAAASTTSNGPKLPTLKPQSLSL